MSLCVVGVRAQAMQRPAPLFIDVENIVGQLPRDEWTGDAVTVRQSGLHASSNVANHTGPNLTTVFTALVNRDVRQKGKVGPGEHLFCSFPSFLVADVAVALPLCVCVWVCVCVLRCSLGLLLFRVAENRTCLARKMAISGRPSARGMCW